MNKRKIPIYIAHRTSALMHPPSIKVIIKLSLCHFLYRKLRKGLPGWNKRLHGKISLQKQPITAGLTATDWAKKKAARLINSHHVLVLKNKKCYLSVWTAVLSFECHECLPLKWAAEVPAPGLLSYTLITAFFVCPQQNSTPQPQTTRNMCLSHPIIADVKVI